MGESAARNVTEAQLVQAQKREALGQLTGRLPHDFKNMLAVVLGPVSPEPVDANRQVSGKIAQALVRDES